MLLNSRGPRCVLGVTVLGGMLLAPGLFAAEDHVVSQADLRNELRSASAARQQNIAKLQEFLSSNVAQKAIDSARLDGDRIRNAVPLLSDSELARLNDKAAAIQKDFAAGALTTGQVTLIILGAILVAVIVAISAA